MKSYLAIAVLLLVSSFNATADSLSIKRFTLYTASDAVIESENESVSTVFIFNQQVYQQALVNAQKYYQLSNIFFDKNKVFEADDIAVVSIKPNEITFKIVKPESFYVEFDHDGAVNYQYLTMGSYISDWVWLFRNNDLSKRLFMGAEGNMVDERRVVLLAPSVFDRAKQMAFVLKSAEGGILFGAPGCGAGSRACDGESGAD